MSGGDWKAMFKGIQENDFELVKYYLNVGIDPNYQHPEFMALPLAESIRYNHLDITQLLLEKGADPLIIERESNSTCLAIVEKTENKAFIELLRKYIEA